MTASRPDLLANRLVKGGPVLEHIARVWKDRTSRLARGTISAEHVVRRGPDALDALDEFERDVAAGVTAHVAGRLVVATEVRWYVGPDLMGGPPGEDPDPAVGPPHGQRITRELLDRAARQGGAGLGWRRLVCEVESLTLPGMETPA